MGGIWENRCTCNASPTTSGTVRHWPSPDRVLLRHKAHLVTPVCSSPSPYSLQHATLGHVNSHDLFRSMGFLLVGRRSVSSREMSRLGTAFTATALRLGCFAILGVGQRRKTEMLPNSVLVIASSFTAPCPTRKAMSCRREMGLRHQDKTIPRHGRFGSCMPSRSSRLRRAFGERMQWPMEALLFKREACVLAGIVIETDDTRSLGPQLSQELSA